MEMRRRGHSADAVDAVIYRKLHGFMSQCPKCKLWAEFEGAHSLAGLARIYRICVRLAWANPSFFVVTKRARGQVLGGWLGRFGGGAIELYGDGAVEATGEDDGGDQG